jgi:O-glycosyl hydrolase
MKRILLILIASFLTMWSCANDVQVHEKVPEDTDESGDPGEPTGPVKPPAPDYPDDPRAVTYNIVTSRQFQEIDNFGASDAWTMKYVGKNWPVEKREYLADLLFSRDYDENGKPRGIGLSLWRVLFGAGSDGHSGMTHEWQTGGCIRDQFGIYDLSRLGVVGGQFWFLEAAKKRGVEQLLGFCNSPPWYWTATGWTNARNDESYLKKLNITDEHLPDFATYLAEIVSRTKELYGVDFDYVCPLNEPEWQADGMESCHANNTEIEKVARAVASKFTQYGLSTQVVIPESGKPHFVYGADPGDWSPTRDNYAYKARNFFSEREGNNYIGNVPNIARQLAVHSYWSVNTTTELRQVRQKVGEEIAKWGIKYWQTEFCILSDDPDIGSGSGRDYSMALALYVARVMFADLVYANASAWHWWLAATGVDYKDGLIYLIGNPQDGEVRESKLLWGFGNFSRVIRPGAYRVDVESEGEVDNFNGVMVSAYRNSDGGAVAVMINYSDEPRTVRLTVNGTAGRTFAVYQTSDAQGDDLRPVVSLEGGYSYTLPARSIVTFNEWMD